MLSIAAVSVAGIDEITAGGPMDSDTRLLVSYDDAMRILGDLGRTKFYELIEDRELDRVKIGRRGFITAKSIAAYVNRLSAAASA
jgi:hypothetical protein